MSDDRDDEETGRDRAKEIELRRAARRQRAIERLGTNNPKCVRCGEFDSRVLELQGGGRRRPWHCRPPRRTLLHTQRRRSLMFFSALMPRGRPR